MGLRIEVAGETNVGMKRTHNEDNFSIIEDSGLYIVADGMGGHASGELLQLGDIVETSAKDLVKAEALKSVNRSHMEAEDKATMAEALGFTFSRPITSISDFTITEKGLRFNPGNNLPHAMAALAPANGYLVSWKSIRAQIKDTPATAAIRALADRAN